MADGPPRRMAHNHQEEGRMADAPAPPPAPDADPTPDTDATPDPTPADTIDWKAEARKWESNAKKANKALDDLKQQTMTDQEKAVAAAKAEGRSEALSEANKRLVRAEVKAVAATKLADPDDALGLLGDVDQFVNDNGDVDARAIANAVDALVTAKPYLAPPSNGRPADLGARRPAATSGVQDFDMDSWLRSQAK